MQKIKLSEIHKKIILNTVGAVLLSLLISTLFSYLAQLKVEGETRIRQIEDEISAIRVETANLQSRESDAKRYKELWSRLDEGKKSTNGITIDDINENLKKAVDRYAIMSSEIKVEVPQVLKDGPFARKTVNLIFTTINLRFYAANDLKAVMFANDFINSFSGYVVVTGFEITKNKSYNRQDLIDISTGKGAGSIVGNLTFVWYAYKEIGASNDGNK